MRDRFLSAFTMVSRLPVRAAFTFDSTRFDFNLPLVGLCCAVLSALVYGIAGFLTGSPLLQILFSLGFQYFAFNLYHLDGLTDTADAFLGTVDKEKRLAILKDSRMGVYGFFAGFADLALKIALLLSLSRAGEASGFAASALMRAVFWAYPISGRLAASLVPTFAPPLNPNSTGGLSKHARRPLAFAGALLALALLCAASFAALALLRAVNPAGVPSAAAASPILMPLCALILLPAASALLSALFYARLYHTYLGGYSGDALGAAVESAEIIHLLLAHQWAHWWVLMGAA
jgi:adenosylcobinamide-GDP ribazoletransferase